MSVLIIVLLIFVVASSILTAIDNQFLGKVWGHEFDRYFWVLMLLPVYLFFIIGLLSDSKNYVSHLKTFSILTLLFEQAGIYFFIQYRVRKQLPAKKSLGPFYSYLTPTIFIPLVFSLVSLLNYPGKFMTISSNASTIALYFCHILVRVFIWTWKFMVLRKLSQLSLGSRDLVG